MIREYEVVRPIAGNDLETQCAKLSVALVST